MALPQQVKTARLSDSTTASTIDNEIGNLEQAIADIFGIPVNTNITAAIMVVVAGGLTKLVFSDLAGDPDTVGHLVRNARELLFWDGAKVITVSGYPRNHLAGLAISNNGTDANKDIDIAVGEARNSDNTENLTLTSALTKQLDASWAVGNDAGGLFSGSVAADTWYHFFLIKRTDTGVVDAGFDTSVTAANIPANYDKFRLIESVLTDGSSNIIAIVHDGDDVWWKVPVVDLSTSNPGATAATRTLTVPTGRVLKALCSFHGFDTSPAGSRAHLATSLDITDTAPTTILADMSIIGSSSAVVGADTTRHVKTNTSGQIRTRWSASDASLNYSITTHGWQSRR